MEVKSLRGGGYDARIISNVSSWVSLGVFSIGYFSFVGSSSKPSHSYLTSSIGDCRINGFSKNKRVRKKNSLIHSRIIKGNIIGVSKRGLQSKQIWLLGDGRQHPCK